MKRILASTCIFYKNKKPELNRKGFVQLLTVQVDSAGVFVGTCREKASSTVAAGLGKWKQYLPCHIRVCRPVI